jgi:hypothetical protein
VIECSSRVGRQAQEREHTKDAPSNRQRTKAREAQQRRYLKVLCVSSIHLAYIPRRVGVCDCVQGIKQKSESGEEGRVDRSMHWHEPRICCTLYSKQESRSSEAFLLASKKLLLRYGFCFLLGGHGGFLSTRSATIPKGPGDIGCIIVGKSFRYHHETFLPNKASSLWRLLTGRTGCDSGRAEWVQLHPGCSPAEPAQERIEFSQQMDWVLALGRDGSGWRRIDFVWTRLEVDGISYHPVIALRADKRQGSSRKRSKQVERGRTGSDKSGSL